MTTETTQPTAPEAPAASGRRHAAPLVRFLLGRLAVLLVSLFIASLLIFVILRLLPGNPGGALLGAGTTDEQLELLRRDLGADQPVHAQYVQWLRDAVTGQTASFVSGQPFSTLTAQRIPITVPLSLIAFVLAVLVSVPLGVIAAVRRRGPIGIAVSALSQLGIAVPIFWVGILLIWFLALRAGLLPAGGFPRQGWTEPVAALRSLALPAITIAIAMASVMVRYVRSAVLDVLESDYIRTARSLGYSLGGALRRHGFRNAAVPVISVLGIELATSLLGAVVVENVFALPGLGTLLLSSVTARDLPIVQNLVLLLTAVVLMVNMLVDVLQRVIDPRLRLVSSTTGGGDR